MARNRKRAKERRSRRPATSQVGRPGVATARAEREARDPERNGADAEELEEAPSPIEHATPDVELADAQLAVGREDDESDAEDVDDEELEAEATGGAPAGVASTRGEPAGGRLVQSNEAAVQPSRAGLLHRLLTFLEGSWRELQRVQWPDRRQVMQATGVVIGFVIVAGLFLGLADLVATKLVNLILQ